MKGGVKWDNVSLETVGAENVEPVIVGISAVCFYPAVTEKERMDSRSSSCFRLNEDGRTVVTISCFHHQPLISGTYRAFALVLSL